MTDQPLDLQERAQAQLIKSQRTSLRGVSETLLIPLAARALRARHDPENFSDPLSGEFLRLLGEELSRFERDRWNMAGGWARTFILDRELKSSLAKRHSTVVVNLGAGLCSRYWRLGAPRSIRWVDVDLPDVIDLKRRLIAACEAARIIPASEWTGIAGDVTKGDWIEETARADAEEVIIIAEGLLMYLPEVEVRRLLDRLVATYPGAQMYLEAWSPFVSRVWGHFSHAIRRTNTHVQWGLGRPSDLTEWNSNIRVSGSWSPGDIDPRAWGLLRLTPRLRRSLTKIIELRFEE